MAILDIVLFPEEREVLTTMCEPVEEVTDEIRTLVDDMIETMYHANGVGLAAPQIGVTKRVTVIDIRRRPSDEKPPEGEVEETKAPQEISEAEDKVFVLINPEILEREGKLKWEEGCLSFPSLYGEVVRANKVKVRALDRDGEPYEFEAEGLLAVALQHEIDHLDGVLFLDRMSRLKRRMAQKEYKKIRARMLEEALEKEEEESGSDIS
ncbi:peptide deformylase [Bradymonas sediminis]|uniref:Peptide deformylase n=1 Tax=Bradymonas sediminis TaxID=1548548 RepID=A0A2Z4FK98_9DELT|nr:peptide deformylase [Bradymonas sediminis]AWV89275.1 peptide deformylase [Bradymonas sediminis]TDP73446.1 peptide deformylase [Bradymonas sediminis]